MDFNHDLHVHTNLSACARKDAFPEAYLKVCQELGLNTIGFSNHMWDPEVPGANAWYTPQTLEHVLSIKNELPSDYPVRVIIGCEAEFTGKDHVSLSMKNAKRLDYVLVSASHFHLPGLVRPKEIRSPDPMRELLLERFYEAASLSFDVQFGIVHPFHPYGWDELAQEILSGISDDDYRICLSQAAKNNVSVELHAVTLKPHTLLDESGFSLEYIRMLKIAKECGCTFHFGSDSHCPDAMYIHDSLVGMAITCGITASDITQF